MKHHWNVILSISLLLFVGCPFYPSYDIKYEKGKVPEQVTNWHEINTKWDDMNSAGPPSIVDGFTLFLSTNRASSGVDFNIHWFDVTIHFGQTDGQFTISAYNGPKCRDAINSSLDEYGPYILSAKKGPLSNYRFESDNGWYEVPASLFFLASSRRKNKDLDIYVSELTCANKLASDSSGSDIAMNGANALNSTNDDAYPTIGPDKKIYFCSNRNGNFDIFALSLLSDPYKDLNDLKAELIDSTKKHDLTAVSILNSDSDEKCPYIVDSTMLFVSDRSGSVGGFDIWRSTFTNGKWTTPTNMGSVINSKANEYRPILVKIKDFENSLMIFSSDRDGGNGGYDIYYTGSVL